MNDANLPQKLKLPSHVMKFRCARCTECCTNKWKIDVDMVSYEKLYQKFEQSGRQRELYNNILFHNVAPQIRFRNNGKCPFLSSNSLCAIQLEFGAEYLPDICKIYPRRLFASQHTLDFSLSLSCRTAVETLLQEQVRIIEIPWPLEDGQNGLFSFISPNTVKRYSPDKSPLADSQLPYYIMENYFIELLQDRRYSVSQRLVILGHVLGCLISGDPLPGSEEASRSIPIIPSDNRPYSIEPDLKQHLKQCFLVSNIFLTNSLSIARLQILRSILLTVSSGKPYPIETAPDMVYARVAPPPPGEYQKKLEQYYYPLRGMIEHILENYMINFIISKHFYLQPPHLAYYRMAFAYAAIIAFGLGYSILTNQPFSQKTTLQAIYDIENIFYDAWFYPYAAALQGGLDYRQTIKYGIALANI